MQWKIFLMSYHAYHLINSRNSQVVKMTFHYESCGEQSSDTWVVNKIPIGPPCHTTPEFWRIKWPKNKITILIECKVTSLSNKCKIKLQFCNFIPICNLILVILRKIQLHSYWKYQTACWQPILLILNWQYNLHIISQ